MIRAPTRARPAPAPPACPSPKRPLKRSGDLPHQLDVLALVVADRHLGRPVGEHVGGHQHRVIEERRRGQLARGPGLFLELGHAVEVAVGRHRRQQPGQLGVLADVGLAEEDAALRVEPGGEQDRGGVEDALPQVGRVVRHRDRVQVDDAEDRRLAPVLPLDVLADRADVVAEVLAAGRLDAGEDDGTVSHGTPNLICGPASGSSPSSAALPERRFGSRMPTAETRPPMIISAPPNPAPRWKAEVEASLEALTIRLASPARTPSVFGTPSGCSLASATAPAAAGASGRSPEPTVEPRAEVRRDHRAEHGDRQQPRHPRDAVVDPGGDPDPIRRDRVEHGRGQRRHRHRHPEAEEQHRRQHVDDVGPAGVEPHEEEHPGAGDERPDGHRQPRPELRGELAEARREEEEAEGDRQRR